jgi:hypothetical protein
MPWCRSMASLPDRRAVTVSVIYPGDVGARLTPRLWRIFCAPTGRCTVRCRRSANTAGRSRPSPVNTRRRSGRCIRPSDKTPATQSVVGLLHSEFEAPRRGRDVLRAHPGIGSHPRPDAKLWPAERPELGRADPAGAEDARVQAVAAGQGGTRSREDRRRPRPGPGRRESDRVPEPTAGSARGGGCRIRDSARPRGCPRTAASRR